MKYIFLIFTAGSFLFFSCNNPSKGSPDFTIEYSSIPGVDPNLLSLDIYNEGITGPAPVVIWVHGGGWAIGDKSNGMEFKEELCKQNNYVLVSVNYRLTSAGNGVQHPVHVQDVAKAVAWTYENISQYSGDSSKIVIMGHSSGAHLAALLCTDETYLEAEGYDLGIIDGCGSFDTEAYDIPTSMANGNEDNSIYLNAFTGDSNIWLQASPLSHIAPGKNIPSYFLLARRGNTNRQQICNNFGSSLSAALVNVNIIDATSINHEQVNDFIGAPDDPIMTPYVVDFLQVAFN